MENVFFMEKKRQKKMRMVKSLNMMKKYILIIEHFKIQVNVLKVYKVFVVFKLFLIEFVTDSLETW